MSKKNNRKNNLKKYQKNNIKNNQKNNIKNSSKNIIKNNQKNSDKNIKKYIEKSNEKIKKNNKFFVKKISVFLAKFNRKKLQFFLAILIIIFFVVIGKSIKLKNNFYRMQENEYSSSFYQMAEYVQNVQIYLLKATISGNATCTSENLVKVWRDANLAETYLSMLPIQNNNIENTEKFLNQTSEYCYALSKKTFNGEDISQDELKKLENLLNYSSDLNVALNDFNSFSNTNSVKSLEEYLGYDYADNIEQNFKNYSGLIYDGAFSDHLTNPDRVGLTGDDIELEQAKNIAINCLIDKRLKKVYEQESSVEANIETYNFILFDEDDNEFFVAISKKGGHIVSINTNRAVENINITEESAENNAINFLEQNNFYNMRKTYQVVHEGIETINFAYVQNGITMYTDLIKVKVAMDNGEILGIETTGYLNSHQERAISKNIISEEEAREELNNDYEFKNGKLTIIPTEFSTEVLCWEFYGSNNQGDFLVYVNAENKKTEQILIIINSENGTLTI